MDRLDAMQVLLAVVDEGSLSAASRKLNTPLPNVSRRVTDLEDRLRTKLLIRTSRNIQLTDAGKKYVEAARRIVAQIEDAERQASGEYVAPRGELTITVPVEFSRVILSPLLRPFADAFPDISLNILAMDGPVQLVEGHIDVAIRIGELADSSLYAIKVGEVVPITCASPEYISRKGQPTTPDELSDHDGVIFGALNERPWKYAGAREMMEGRPSPRMRANVASAAISAAVSGLGIVRAFDYQIADQLQTGTLVRILDDFRAQPIAVHLIYVRQGLVPLKTRAFIDWAAPRIREVLRSVREPVLSQG